MAPIPRERVHLGRPRQGVTQRVHVVRNQQRNLQYLGLTHRKQQLLFGTPGQSVLRTNNQHEIVLTTPERHHRAVRIARDRTHRGQLQHAQRILRNGQPRHRLVGMSRFRLEQRSPKERPLAGARQIDPHAIHHGTTLQQRPLARQQLLKLLQAVRRQRVPVPVRVELVQRLQRDRLGLVRRKVTHVDLRHQRGELEGQVARQREATLDN